MAHRRNPGNREEKYFPIGSLPPVVKHKAAEETIKIVNEGFYINSKEEKVDVKEMVQNAIDKSFLITLDHVSALPEEKTGKGEIEITKEFSLDACERMVKEGIEKPVCLNFASARNPGGGFCGPNEAQEENLCRCSALYFTQIKHPQMYEYNRKNKTLLYSDMMIFSPDVPVWKNTKYQLLDNPYCISFITAPACNASRRIPLEELRPAMYHRCELILKLAIENGCKGIILGAYGCGVFKNKVEDVAGYFKDLLIDHEYLKYFDKVVFAVPDGKNRAFHAILGV